jgi:hypothetical protein
MLATTNTSRALTSLPSSEKIRQMTAEIQRSWSQTERLCRLERARVYQQRLMSVSRRVSAA